MLATTTAIHTFTLTSLFELITIVTSMTLGLGEVASKELSR